MNKTPPSDVEPGMNEVTQKVREERAATSPARFLVDLRSPRTVTHPEVSEPDGSGLTAHPAPRED